MFRHNSNKLVVENIWSEPNYKIQILRNSTDQTPSNNDKTVQLLFVNFT